MKPINTDKINSDLERVCNIGLELMEKKEFEAQDFAKLKAMRAMSSYMNARVAMVQQETAQQKVDIIRERLSFRWQAPKKQIKNPNNTAQRI